MNVIEKRPFTISILKLNKKFRQQEDTESSCNKIIHGRQQHGELQFGFHLSYENEKESISSWNITLLWLGSLYCKSLSNKSVPVWHKNDINHKLVPVGEKAVEFPSILYDLDAECINYLKTPLPSLQPKTSKKEP